MMAKLLLVLIYISFISLGLPDALLGSAWPVMQPELDISYGYAGIVQAIILGGTIVSTILTGIFLRYLGFGKLTALSVGCTACALLGFSLAPSFVWLLFFALPLGIGAGAVDTGLNVYVANHYESRHMSWLHAAWGIGALAGPFILALFLHEGKHWRLSYQSVGIFQVFLFVLLILSIPLWKSKEGCEDVKRHNIQLHMPFFSALKIPGIPMALMVFFLYCGIESSMGLWGGSYLFKVVGMSPARAATWVSFYYATLTFGRIFTGFLTWRFSNNSIIFWGGLLIVIGVLMLLLPLPIVYSKMAFLFIGFGCAPIFPCMIHETPIRFGQEASESIMGMQMALGYIGATILPPLFGVFLASSNMAFLPVVLLGYGLLMILGIERLQKVCCLSG